MSKLLEKIKSQTKESLHDKKVFMTFFWFVVLSLFFVYIQEVNLFGHGQALMVIGLVALSVVLHRIDTVSSLKVKTVSKTVPKPQNKKAKHALGILVLVLSVLWIFANYIWRPFIEDFLVYVLVPLGITISIGAVDIDIYFSDPEKKRESCLLLDRLFFFAYFFILD